MQNIFSFSLLKYFCQYLIPWLHRAKERIFIFLALQSQNMIWMRKIRTSYEHKICARIYQNSFFAISVISIYFWSY